MPLNDQQFGESIWPIRVYYEDTDAGGVVYHANYLRFMERARTEWLRNLGLDQARLRQDHAILFIVSKAEVHYRAAARLDDALLVKTSVSRLGKASILFQQQVLKGTVSAQVLVDATVRIGCVDAQAMRPCRLPTELYTQFQSYLNDHK